MLVAGAQGALSIIEAGLADATLVVQIAAAWALANLADGLTHDPYPGAQQHALLSGIAEGVASTPSPPACIAASVMATLQAALP